MIAVRDRSPNLEDENLAKKKNHEDEIRQGLIALRESGIALDRPRRISFLSLKTLLGKSRETDLAVIFSLGKIADPTAVEALGDIERQSPDKEIKKEIKRSLFKLSQKGLDDAARKGGREKVHALVRARR